MEKKGKVLFKGMSLVCLVIFLISGLAHAQAPNTVKFGCVYPLTGPMATYGESLKFSTDTTVKYINENGGIKSLGGAKLEVVFGDNQMKPAVAATETERLIDQKKVVAVFGMPPSATTLAGSAAAERLKTPFLDSTSFADQLCQRGFRYFFELQPTAYYMVETQMAFLNYFNKTYSMNIKRVGIIHEDTDYGKSLSRAQRILLPKNGYEIVADIEYNAKSPDLSSPVLKLKSSNPQFVITSSYFTDGLLIAKNMNRLGLRVPSIDSENKGQDQYIKAAGPVAEGDFLLIQWNKDLSHPISKELNRRFEEVYPNKWYNLNGAGFQLVYVLKRAIEAAGSAERDAIRDALHKIEILPGPELVLPYEKIKFDETGMNTYGRPMVGQTQKGEVVTVWPEKFAVKKALILEGWKKP